MIEPNVNLIQLTQTFESLVMYHQWDPFIGIVRFNFAPGMDLSPRNETGNSKETFHRIDILGMLQHFCNHYKVVTQQLCLCNTVLLCHGDIFWEVPCWTRARKPLAVTVNCTCWHKKIASSQTRRRIMTMSLIPRLQLFSIVFRGYKWRVLDQVLAIPPAFIWISTKR